MQGVPLTPDQKIKFIKKLKASNGNVSKACQAIQIHRATIYDHKKNDPDFAELWQETIDQITDEVEQELHRRAVKGVMEPVFYRGAKVATVRKFSDRLIEFYLKGHKPDKYRERFDIDTNVKGSLDINIQAKIDEIYDTDGTDTED